MEDTPAFLFEKKKERKKETPKKKDPEKESPRKRDPDYFTANLHLSESLLCTPSPWPAIDNYPTPAPASVPVTCLIRSYSSSRIMNPYVTNPADIPTTDQYADVPSYGRYSPKLDDFRVDPQHVNSQSTAALQYWASVLGLCDESVRIYPADQGGRDVFALGSVIIKSSHLHNSGDGRHVETDYSYADANELQAIVLARNALNDVRVPDIYFSGKVTNPPIVLL